VPVDARGIGASSVTDDPVERAWRMVLPRADEVADVISARLLARDLDTYSELSTHLPDDIRQSCREHIRRGLQVLSGLTPVGESAVDLWRETGRRRARQGVPLELVLNAYTMGARVLWEALTEAAASDGAPDVPDTDLLLAARAVWSNLDVQNAVLIEAYHRERDRVQRRDQQRQQTVMDGLADGRGGDPAFAEEARRALGIGDGDSVACLVVLADAADADPVGHLEDHLLRQGIGSHWHVRSGVAYGLLAGELPDEAGLVAMIEPAPAGRVAVAVSDGIGGFGTAFQLAMRSARTVPSEGGVVGVTDRLPEVLLAGDSHVTPLLIHEAFGALLDHPQARMLLATLRALLAHDGSPTHAAEELYCHRNTVIYRMKQIERLTGRDLTDPRDKMLLWLALTARP
jgi:PucR C-terminal helix-turn-helix domain